MRAQELVGSWTWSKGHTGVNLRMKSWRDTHVRRSSLLWSHTPLLSLESGWHRTRVNFHGCCSPQCPLTCPLTKVGINKIKILLCLLKLSSLSLRYSMSSKRSISVTNVRKWLLQLPYSQPRGETQSICLTGSSPTLLPTRMLMLFWTLNPTAWFELSISPCRHLLLS